MYMHWKMRQSKSWWRNCCSITTRLCWELSRGQKYAFLSQKMSWLGEIMLVVDFPGRMLVIAQQSFELRGHCLEKDGKSFPISLWWVHQKKLACSPYLNFFRHEIDESWPTLKSWSSFSASKASRVCLQNIHKMWAEAISLPWSIMNELRNEEITSHPSSELNRKTVCQFWIPGPTLKGNNYL